ncbi:hypothetical protein [Pseudaestuariivita rosea]|uniref:hypothetical protein n=1 Tax=Pseudaestuariivita rosea TaxID=2763263 RepID=UPI001ABB7311|nr:hypothetical protein [Pseudaestuariivita rosea]
MSLCVFSFVAQAPFIHGFSFDLLSLFPDLLCAPKVEVSGRQVAQALVVFVVAVVSDEVVDLTVPQDHRAGAMTAFVDE